MDVAIIFTIRRLIHLHQSASANSTITRSSSSSSSIIIIIIKARSSSVSVSIGIICGLAISAPHRVWHLEPSIRSTEFRFGFPRDNYDSNRLKHTHHIKAPTTTTTTTSTNNP
ncbi:hypothetical protein CGMCC3_g2785 [Colletotrichum fructicola]|nr:uncharacterized protein CGMCC3_g2785 [Colletotrichum fructicola]KAE9581485.1 hypothetical protein CGMCC3_g2785 [Colletotrichum fructicola]